MKTTGDNAELQKRMNARLWQCVLDNDGVQDFAKLSGISPQTLYNIRDNRTFPSTPTIKVFTRVAPIDLALLYADNDSTAWQLEKNTADPPTAKPANVPHYTPESSLPDLMPVLQAKDEMIEAQGRLIEKLASRVDTLELRNEIQAAQIVKLSDRDFPGSDSQNTADTFPANMYAYKAATTSHMQRIGYEVPNLDQPAKAELIDIAGGLNLVTESGNLCVGPRKQVEVSV